ncbi:MAG: hypothetical protein HeimC2_09210 [Candidatus Heimdallarchaeota archaeon LC_2]|nr:MAG: hypothetical protein HeimC2_09210 [Candidatus Heimdallarchaeota archaeon LC_2]
MSHSIKENLDSTKIISDFFRLGYIMKRVIDQNYEMIDNLRKEFNKQSKDNRITNQQIIIMLFLYVYHDSQVKDIAYNMNKKPSNIVAQLNHLESLGFISREEHHQDKRKLSINITRYGKDFIDSKKNSLSDRISTNLNNLDPSKKNQVHHAFTLIIETLTDIESKLYDSVYFFN